MATRREATDGEPTVYDESEDATTRGGTDDLFAFTDRTAVDSGLPRRAVGLPAVTGPRPTEPAVQVDPDEETAFDPPLVDVLVAALPTEGRARVGAVARGAAESSAGTQPRGAREGSLATQPRAVLEASLATQPRAVLEASLTTQPHGVEVAQVTSPRAPFGAEGTHSTVSQRPALSSAGVSAEPRVPPVSATPQGASPSAMAVRIAEASTHVAPPPARSALIADFEPTHEVDSAAVRWVDLSGRATEADPTQRQPHVPEWLALLERFEGVGGAAITTPEPRSADDSDLGAVVPPASAPGSTDRAPLVIAERPDPRARPVPELPRKPLRDPASIEAIASLSDLPAARPRRASSGRGQPLPPAAGPAWGASVTPPTPQTPPAPARAPTPPPGAAPRAPGLASTTPGRASPAPQASPAPVSLASPARAVPWAGVSSRPIPPGPEAAALIAPVALARVDSAPRPPPAPSSTPAPPGPVPSALRARPLVFSTTTPKGPLAPGDTVPLAPRPMPPQLPLGTPPEPFAPRPRPPPDYATIAAAVLVVIAIGLLLVVRWVAR